MHTTNDSYFWGLARGESVQVVGINNLVYNVIGARGTSKLIWTLNTTHSKRCNTVEGHR